MHSLCECEVVRNLTEAWQLDVVDAELSPRTSKVFKAYIEKGRQAILSKSNSYAELIAAYGYSNYLPIGGTLKRYLNRISPSVLSREKLSKENRLSLDASNKGTSPTRSPQKRSMSIKVCGSSTSPAAYRDRTLKF